MGFLLGRALANNISNLRLGPDAQQFAKNHLLDLLQIIEQEPDAGLGNGGLGRLAACFLDSMATLGIGDMGYGLRYDYGISRQSLRDGWQAEQPDHWLVQPDPSCEVTNLVTNASPFPSSQVVETFVICCGHCT